jgi:hypothetical protein
MARRKNTKRFDPRYFLHETVNRNDDGTVLEEANDPTHWIAQGEGLKDVSGDVLVKRGQNFAAVRGKRPGIIMVGTAHGTGTERWFDRAVDAQELKNHQPNPNYRAPQELEETEVPEPLQESWALVARAVMTLLGSESGRKMMTAVLNKLVEVMAWLGQADDAILDKVFGAEMPPFLNQLQELGTGVTAITALADMIEGMNDEDAKVINTVVQAAAEE